MMCKLSTWKALSEVCCAFVMYISHTWSICVNVLVIRNLTSFNGISILQPGLNHGV